MSKTTLVETADGDFTEGCNRRGWMGQADREEQSGPIKSCRTTSACCPQGLLLRHLPPQAQRTWLYLAELCCLPCAKRKGLSAGSWQLAMMTTATRLFFNGHYYTHAPCSPPRSLRISTPDGVSTWPAEGVDWSLISDIDVILSSSTFAWVFSVSHENHSEARGQLVSRSGKLTVNSCSIYGACTGHP